MNPPGDFNAENWLSRSLAARSAQALSAFRRVELRLALEEARTRLNSPLATFEAAALLDHASKLQRAGYSLGEPFRPEQPEPPAVSSHELAAVRAGGGLRSGEEAETWNDDDTFGLAGLPSARSRGGRRKNDTRRETGRPALPLVR